MRKVGRSTAPPLIDVVRPSDADGPLLSFVCSTYGLSLDQPDFFGQDFLPTVLGLGSVRDRGYAVPVALERKLKDVFGALIVDAHALADTRRPSLQIELLIVGHRTNHAKVVLLHRKRLIRLVVTSANLTHDGYRHQREVGVVLDFKEDGRLPLSILRHALDGWLSVLADLGTESLRKAFASALRQAREWSLPASLPDGQKLSVAFGGGPKPLWQTLVEAWPVGEPLREWYVCSPFWPEPTTGQTPFEAIGAGLMARGADLAHARLHLLTCADSPGEQPQPRFPFQLLRNLHANNFPIQEGSILPVRLEALREETPPDMADHRRELHAKWVLLRGPSTAVVLIGSANFTRKGLGVLRDPAKANIEACVLLTLPATAAVPATWKPPIAERGIVDLKDCQPGQLKEPPREEEAALCWPTFLARIELEVSWGEGPEPAGMVRLVLRPEPHPGFRVYAAPGQGESRGMPLREIAATAGQEPCALTLDVDGSTVRRLLTRRSVLIIWGDDSAVNFPINITEQAKAFLPSVLGACPDEQQLLAYFHGRISEEDLVEFLEKQAARGRSPLTTRTGCGNFRIIFSATSWRVSSALPKCFGSPSVPPAPSSRRSSAITALSPWRSRCFRHFTPTGVPRPRPPSSSLS